MELEKDQETVQKTKYCAFCDIEIIPGKEIKVISSGGRHYRHDNWSWRWRWPRQHIWPHDNYSYSSAVFYLCPPCFHRYRLEQRQRERRKRNIFIFILTFVLVLLFLSLVLAICLSFK